VMTKSDSAQIATKVPTEYGLPTFMANELKSLFENSRK
jgi:hypothetical protein